MILRRRILLGIFSALFISVALYACSTGYRPMESIEIREAKALSLTAVSRSEWLHAGKAYSYLESGAQANPAIVFIHGTPGNASDTIEFLNHPELIRRFHLVAIDRPGWGGNADYPVMTSFADVADWLAPLLTQLSSDSGQPSILAGHSLGASMVPRIAAQHPDEIAGLMLLAGSHDPILGEPRWYNSFADNAVVGWVIGETLRRSNDEIMPLADELRAMQSLWESVQVPVTVIQGGEDTLVYPANAAYVREQAAHLGENLKVLELPAASHFLLWENEQLVVDELLLLANRVELSRAKPN